MSNTTHLFRSSPPKGKYLVVTNKGPGSFEIPLKDDSWDLMEIYFMPGDIERIKREPASTKAEHVVFETDRHNRKLAIVKKIFEANNFWEAYDAIFITDDDIVPEGCTMTEIFDSFMTTGCRIGQPTITQDSPFGHMIAVQNKNFLWRRTNFVEIQCPIFTRDALKEYLHIFDGTISQFGIDAYWSFLEWQKGIGVAMLDCCPVRHHRPIEGGIAYQGIDDPHQEGINFQIKHRIPKYPFLCLEGMYARKPDEDEIKLAMAFLGYNRRITKDGRYHEYIMNEIAMFLNKRSNSSRH